MVLTYYGLTCFKIQVGDDVLAIDPFGKGNSLASPRFEATAVLLSNPESKEEISITGNPLVFSTPGEYETRNISIVGIPTEEGTVFTIEWEGIHVLHLGTVEKAPSVEPVLTHAKTTDILMISTAGDISAAQKIIAQIDPRIIIPMLGSGASKSSLDTFIKASGEKAERLDKLTIKKKNLPAEGQRIIILDSA